jgi:hypothetical protein
MMNDEMDNDDESVEENKEDINSKFMLICSALKY